MFPIFSCFRSSLGVTKNWLNVSGIKSLYDHRHIKETDVELVARTKSLCVAPQLGNSYTLRALQLVGFLSVSQHSVRISNRVSIQLKKTIRKSEGPLETLIKWVTGWVSDENFHKELLTNFTCCKLQRGYLFIFHQEKWCQPLLGRGYIWSFWRS